MCGVFLQFVVMEISGDGLWVGRPLYGEFLKAPNKKIFRQAHSDKLAQYEEALQILKQYSPDGKFPTMKDLRAEKAQLTIQKDSQYDTYHLRQGYRFRTLP